MSGRIPVLLLGWGNPGREDDGLGPACIEAFARRDLPQVHCEQDYQLQIEHAADVARAELVIFVDAARYGPAPFFVERVTPREQVAFTTHALDAESVLAVAADVFGARVPAWRIGIRGTRFDGLRERLSAEARDNLAHAIAFLEETLHATDPVPALERAACAGAAGGTQ